MKAGEVLTTLDITRPTLKHYRECGYIKYKALSNGQFDYDRESVYIFKNRREPRLTVIYGRVSTYKQKSDLANQMDALTKFAQKKGLKVDKQYQDIASGISFKKRKQFFDLLDLVLEGKVEKVIITHKDRLSRGGFDLFKHLFDKYGTKIIIMSDYLDSKTDEQEIMIEMSTLFDNFAMKQYSSKHDLKVKAK